MGELGYECSEVYKDAIRACLRPPWVSAGDKVDLSEPEMRAGFYDHALTRLDKEVEYMLGIRLQASYCQLIKTS